MGNPDLPTAPHIVAKLAEAAGNPRAMATRRRAASRGCAGHEPPIMRGALASSRSRARSSSRWAPEGLANLAQAITSPGDIVLVPNPSYPIHPYGFIIAGGSGAPHPGAGQHLARGILPALERAVRHGPEADRPGVELSVEPDRAGRRSRLLWRDRRFLQAPGHLDPERSRLPRSISTCAAAVCAAGAPARATSPSSSPR